MKEVIAQIILKSMEIFSEERARHFQKELHELLAKITEEEQARFPDYSDARIAQAKLALDTYLIAYQKEFTLQMEAMKKGVPHA